MTTALAETKAYDKLRDDLQKILTEGLQKAQAAVNEIRVSTYWKMGKRLSDVRELADPAEASSVIKQLSYDLGVETSRLYRMIQLYQAWPDAPPALEDGQSLSWTHFVELLSIKDKREREYYLKEAVEKGWGRNALRRAIKKSLYTLEKSPKKEKGAGTTLERPTNTLHTYKAVVEQVVDGDTLLVRIDLGFDVWTSQRIRLRGINTEELLKEGVPTGKSPVRAEQAKTFVQDRLKDIPFVVIKTHKTDMYGRYVADLLYHPTIQDKDALVGKGFFLNADLLDAGLADPLL